MKTIFKIIKYSGSDSIEYFISRESWDGQALFGFLRLRLPTKDSKPYFQSLRNRGLIRELHVYNWVTVVGGQANSTQHNGTGKILLFIAEIISYINSCSGTAVITGEGVRNYYLKLGYNNSETYVIKNITILSIIYSLFIIFKSIISRTWNSIRDTL